MKSCEADNRGAEPAAVRQVVVIGYGSPIRGDDAIGPLVADQLMSELDDPRVEVQSRHILTADLAETLATASLVVFLDAALHGPVGGVERRSLTPDARQLDSMAHSVGPRELLAWTRGLYGACPEAILLTAAGHCFDYAHYELTPQAATAVRPMIQQVKQLVADHLRSRPTVG
jgi:hydrogenase maturation protease